MIPSRKVLAVLVWIVYDNEKQLTFTQEDFRMNMLLTAGSAAGTGTVMVVYIVLIVAFIYFMMIRLINFSK